MSLVREKLTAPCVHMAVGDLRRKLESNGSQDPDKELVRILADELQWVLLQNRIDGNGVPFLKDYHDRCDAAGKLL